MPTLKTLKPDVLTIGTYFVNPPFEFIENNERVGFEVDLMEEICRRLDINAEFVHTRWEVILDEMMAHHYDAIIGGITITAERQKTLNYSTPFMDTTLSIVINQEKTPELKSLTDLKKHTVGVQAATTGLDAANLMKSKGLITNIEIYPFANIQDAMKDLVAGKIGAVIKVFPVADYLVKHNPSLKILMPVPDDPQPLGIGFHKDDTDLLQRINQILADMKQDGGYDKIYRKWFK